jgi:hypothetical protein
MDEKSRRSAKTSVLLVARRTIALVSHRRAWGKSDGGIARAADRTAGAKLLDLWLDSTLARLCQYDMSV